MNINFAKLKPVGDNVLLEVIKQEKVGNIHLPEERTTSQWQPVHCIVLGIGSNPLIECKKGDKVIVNKLTGQSLDQDGKMFKVVSYKDVLCIIS